MGDTMPRRLAVLVLAGGYGRVRGKRKKRLKIFEKVSPSRDSPMILDVIRLARQAVIKTHPEAPIIVVTNGRAQNRLLEWLRYRRLSPFNIVIQTERSGPGGAVDAVLKNQAILEAVTDVLVIFGDMPCWRPETVANLVSDFYRHNPAVSFATISLAGLNGSQPIGLGTYGRVVFDHNGEVVKVIEKYEDEYDTEAMRKWTTVNPSLYLFNLKTLLVLKDEMPRVVKNDEFGGFEYILSGLIKKARDRKLTVRTFSVEDPTEGIGVNNISELRQARRVLEDRQ